MKFLESQNDFDLFMSENKEKLVVIDFTASWCGPCQRIAPEFVKLSEEFANAAFAKVDVDNNSAVSEKYGISCMPTFIFFKNGEKVEEVQGADINALKKAVEKLI